MITPVPLRTQVGQRSSRVQSEIGAQVLRSEEDGGGQRARKPSKGDQREADAYYRRHQDHAEGDAISKGRDERTRELTRVQQCAAPHRSTPSRSRRKSSHCKVSATAPPARRTSSPALRRVLPADPHRLLEMARQLLVALPNLVRCQRTAHPRRPAALSERSSSALAAVSQRHACPSTQRAVRAGKGGGLGA